MSDRFSQMQAFVLDGDPHVAVIDDLGAADSVRESAGLPEAAPDECAASGLFQSVAASAMAED